MEERVALVTGGTKGIGFHIAKQLAQKGIRIIVTARNEDKQAIQELQNLGVACDFLSVDVTSDTDIEKARDFVNSKYGKLDILVNNAAISKLPEPNASARENFLATYNTNVASVAIIMDTFYELLKKSAHPRIVNVSSTVGSISKTIDTPAWAPHFIPYKSTKPALNLLTVVYSQKFPEIKVNALCPGHCKTNLNDYSGARDPAVGAQPAVKLALIGDDGPTGSFFEIKEDGAELTVVPW